MNSNLAPAGGELVGPDQAEELEIIQGGSGQLEMITREEINMQIATAKRFPRSEDRALKKAESLACRDEDTAASMFYSIPRGGKHIQGPSVRLAEVMASTWGNLRVLSRIVEANDRYVTTQSVAHDLESNTAVLVEKRRRVTAKKGRAVDDDMIQLAGLAGASISLRDAVFKVIPRVYVDQIMRKAQEVSLGKAESLVQTRDKMVAYFTKMGVGVERVLASVHCAGLEDVGKEELITLKGLATGIKDGQTTIEDAFPDAQKPAPGNAGAAEILRQKAQGNGKVAEPAKTEAPIQAPPAAATAKQPQEKPETAEAPAAAADSPGEIPEWVDGWYKRIEAMPRWTQASSTFDELLKEYRNAAEADKPRYYDLFDAWAEKSLPYADKPSVAPLLDQKLETMKPYVPESVYGSLKAKAAVAKK